MGYYEKKQKVANELREIFKNRPYMTEEEIKRLKAQIIALYALSKKATDELIQANIEAGFVQIVKDEKEAAEKEADDVFKKVL